MKTAFAVAALLIQPILAIPAFGSALEDRAGYLADVDAYARCTVRNHHSSARDMILSNVDNKSMERKFGDIYTEAPLAFVPNCRELILISRSVIIEPDAFRASIAEVLVKKDHSEGAAGDFTNLPPLTHRQAESTQEYKDKINAAKFEKQRARIKKAHDQDVSRNWLSVYGECIVRFNTSTSRDWVVSKLESSAEAQAISDIKPALSACLMEGETLTLDKYTLRGTLAINYYRMAMADGTTSKGSSN